MTLRMLMIAAFATMLCPAPAAAQLAPPGDAGVAMGHIHVTARNAEATRRFFTALGVAENKTDMKWSVASVPYDPTRRSGKRKKDRRAKSNPPEAAPAVDLSRQTAAAALDRISVPEDVREQIADVMKPGSSVVISDLAIGNETGEYTDFIVPIR